MAIGPLVTHGMGSFSTIAFLTTHGFGIGAPAPPSDTIPSGSYPKKYYQDVPAGWEPVPEPKKRRKRQTPKIFERTPATIQEFDAPITGPSAIEQLQAYADGAAAEKAMRDEQRAAHRQRLLDEDEIILRLFLS